MIRDQVLDWCLPERLAASSAGGEEPLGRATVTGSRAQAQQSALSSHQSGSVSKDAGAPQSSQRSSGSISVSMDLSVSMDVSRTQEESMDFTQERSEVTSAEGSRNLGPAPLPLFTDRLRTSETEEYDTSEPSLPARTEYPSIKRRKIVNSKHQPSTLQLDCQPLLISRSSLVRIDRIGRYAGCKSEDVQRVS